MVSIHGLYWLLPVCAVLAWTGTLLGLLLWWIIDDNHKQYQIGEATVVYISDIGAAHQSLFIPGTACTFVFYSLTLLAGRWLRHLRRIPGVLRKRELWLGIAAVCFGIVGGLALMMLSIFNAFDYSTAHWSLTAVFVVCVAISAACQTLETMFLERDHVDRKHLRRNAIWKLCIVSVAIAGAIVFGGTYAKCSGTDDTQAPTGQCNVIQSVAATMEWFIAFIYDVYLFTLVLDLWPATKTRGPHKFTPSLIDQDRANELHVHKDGRKGGMKSQEDEPEWQMAQENQEEEMRNFGDEERTMGSGSEDTRRGDDAFGQSEKKQEGNPLPRFEFENSGRPGRESAGMGTGAGGKQLVREV